VVLVQIRPGVRNITAKQHRVQFRFRQQYITTPQLDTQFSSHSTSST